MSILVNTNTQPRTVRSARSPASDRPAFRVGDADDTDAYVHHSTDHSTAHSTEHSNGFGFDRRARSNDTPDNTAATDEFSSAALVRILAHLAGQDTVQTPSQQAIASAYESAAGILGKATRYRGRAFN